MITTPVRFFHKAFGLRLEAVETPVYLCGDKEDPCKCALFNHDCEGICLDVEYHSGHNVYFKEVSNEGR